MAALSAGRRLNGWTAIAPRPPNSSSATQSPTLAAARDELQRGLEGLLGAAPPIAASVSAEGALDCRHAAIHADVARHLKLDLDALRCAAAIVIRSDHIAGRSVTVIAANDDIGVLYGAFHFLRLLQTRQSVAQLDVRESPRIRLRMLNHWDNLDRSVERGYAGASLWDWHKLPDYLDPRYTDYARANASLGVNGDGARRTSTPTRRA